MLLESSVIRLGDTKLLEVETLNGSLDRKSEEFGRVNPGTCLVLSCSFNLLISCLAASSFAYCNFKVVEWSCFNLLLFNSYSLIFIFNSSTFSLPFRGDFLV